MKEISYLKSKFFQWFALLIFLLGTNMISFTQTQALNSNHTYTVRTIVYNTLVMSNSKILLKNTLLGIKVSIHKGSEKGEIIYAEMV